MKKSFLLFFSVLSIVLLMSSCGDTKKTSGSSDAESEEVQGVKYENKDFNYVIVLPEGFQPQNSDTEMEKSRGGKLFLNSGCMIDVTATKMEYMGSMTPEKSVKQCLEFQKIAYENPEIKEIDDLSYVVKGQDDFGLRANYMTQKNGNKYMIDVTYPADKKEQFDKDVEALINSFEVK